LTVALVAMPPDSTNNMPPAPTVVFDAAPLNAASRVTPPLTV
jgi:hypothetical protein